MHDFRCHEVACERFPLAELKLLIVRMAERSKALRSGRSPVFRAWVQIPLLTTNFLRHTSDLDTYVEEQMS